MSLRTPILFLVFNRPEETQQVFNRIAEAKPQQLFVAADGAREGSETDVTNLNKVREIVQNVNWDCEVRYLFRDQNLGCGAAVSGAIQWFFDHVEEGIIIEDDCLPNDSFFEFMEEALAHFRNNENVFSINGCNLGYHLNNDFANGYTRFMNMWGWATWRSSLQIVDYDLKKWRETVSVKSLKRNLGISFNNNDVRWLYYWEKIFDDMKAGKVDTWDYQWIFAGLTSEKYSVFPAKNLIRNLGFNDNATHTIKSRNVMEQMQTHSLNTPFNFDDQPVPDRVYEKNYVKKVWCEYIRRPYIIQRLAMLIKGKS